MNKYRKLFWEGILQLVTKASKDQLNCLLSLWLGALECLEEAIKLKLKELEKQTQDTVDGLDGPVGVSQVLTCSQTLESCKQTLAQCPNWSAGGATVEETDLAAEQTVPAGVSVPDGLPTPVLRAVYFALRVLEERASEDGEQEPSDAEEELRDLERALQSGHSSSI
ncbi:Agno [Sheep polyomavirus 1]|uniref:Agno n=1 Tax=Sheep polyomavirus 1 TaxID=1634381 RepID=UPI00061DE036|nr:Agno [Sheep polyomavirus 1]AKC98329.1 Agno [Sheep polyomavirus 1]